MSINAKMGDERIVPRYAMYLLEDAIYGWFTNQDAMTCIPVPPELQRAENLLRCP